MTVGERIKEIRLRLKMSQVAFADKINVSKQTLYKYENNIITNIPSDKIEAVASIGHVSPAYIMGWEMNDEDIANVFVNDCLEDIINNVKEFSPKEKVHFKNYIKLLEINRKKVDDYTNQLLSLQQMESELNAAHARTDVDIPNGVDATENDIMDSDNF